MLVNISNHPSSKWSAEQMAAAVEQFGGVVDLLFPNVPPDANRGAIYALANDIDTAVLNVRGATAVHIMGEMTLTHMAVWLLQERGWDCYASTSERLTTENADGTKTVGFKFVQFRPYY